MKIDKQDLVMEIGSGNNPRERSNILSDRFMVSNDQRAGKFCINIDRPFIVCDGYTLPFIDNAFDYVICSHVLEHLSDPRAFIKEIMRVGKRGYIEVPSILGERLFGWDFHLWYCELQGNTLIMTKKTEGVRFGGFFHRILANAIWFRRFFEEQTQKFYIRYEWERKINIKINDEATKAQINRADADLLNLLQKITWGWKKDTKFYVHWMTARLIGKIKKEFRKIKWIIMQVFFTNKVVEEIFSLLNCPNCMSVNLKMNKHFIICVNCKAKYPIKRAIPIMLVAGELEKGY